VTLLHVSGRRRERPMNHAFAKPLISRTAAVAAALAIALLGSNLTETSAGDLQSQIDQNRSAAASVRSSIAAETARIDQTAGGLAAAQQRLSAVQSELSAREQQLRLVQTRLLAARDELVKLENRLRLASAALSSNLVAGYEGSRPDLVSVILDSHGFRDLLEQVSFLQRVGHQDAQIVSSTQSARAAVARQATSLASLEQRDRVLTQQILAQRNQVAALHAALLNRQIAQMGTRAQDTSKLHRLTANLHALEGQAAAAARRAAAAAAASAAPSANTSPSVRVGGIAVNNGGMVQPPAGAPAAVGQVMAAGNAIATLPYIWGGGHGSFQASGYDCSGSVSYALAAAGLLSSPLDSTGFESWGAPGPGQWITVYANAGHAFMVVGGWRFDTVALAQGGTRWSQSMTGTSGFVARHPPGL
jgi:peptidoglycan hydrolase CwlO-like protein